MAKRKFGLSLLATLVLGMVAQQMKAVTVVPANLGALSGPYTTMGTLANQDQALQATFSLSSAAQLTIFTNSYGGGTNANGSTTAAGGFMPSLVLYSGTGNYVAGQVFPSPMGAMDPVTGLNGDSYIKTATLMAGTYILTLSDFQVQQPPTAATLADGFINYGSGTTFSDVQGNRRTGAYALNITGATGDGPSPVPEPATFWMIVPAISGAALWIRRRKATAQLSE